jgi:hypothetical protein
MPDDTQLSRVNYSGVASLSGRGVSRSATAPSVVLLRANQRFANDWPQPIVNIRWLA